MLEVKVLLDEDISCTSIGTPSDLHDSALSASDVFPIQAYLSLCMIILTYTVQSFFTTCLREHSRIL